jgi:methionyl-tRNA formyltransferase
MLNIVYMGTPEFAVPPLENLIKEGYNIVAVVTQPDRGKNRKGDLLFTPVKAVALKYGVKVLQFNKIRREGVEILKSLNADLFVTCAYGQILSKEILDIPRYGTFNIHASLLPKYRGAAPVQWALINGEKTTGITIMRTDEGIDTGDIILQKPVNINDNENAGELLKRLSETGANTIIQAIKKLENGTITYIKQDDQNASHYPLIRKTDGEIDFSLSAEEINNKIRGLNPEPCCYCFIPGNIMLKVHAGEVIAREGSKGNIGEVVVSDVKNGLIVYCGEGTLRLKRIQLAGGKIMDDTEFLKGRKIPVGSVLSSKN